MSPEQINDLGGYFVIVMPLIYLAGAWYLLIEEWIVYFREKR